MTEPAHTSELTVIEPTPQAIIGADPSLVVGAFQNYVEIQQALDKALPDCIMTTKGKKFRKKVYWRAIATAFNVELELRDERREEHDGDWGYLVTYRAKAGNGRACDGDGACFASEKVDRQGSPTAMQTEHNVRAHAHTRAKNRAIADLVGFGEVSAEEVNHAGPAQDLPTPPQSRTQENRTAAGGPVGMASEAKCKMLWAKSFARAKTLTGEKGAASAICTEALATLGLELPARGEKAQIPDDAIDGIVAAIERVEIDAAGEAYTPASAPTADSAEEPF